MKPGGRGGDSSAGMVFGIASTSRWLPGSRASRLRASRSYGRVLGLVIGSFVFAAAAPDSRWATSVLVLLQSATLVTALWASGVILVRSRFVVGLAALSAAAAVAQLLGGGAGLAGAVSLLSGLLVLVTIFVIAVGVMDQSEVNAQSIRGAICVYLLLGMLFVFVYGAIAVLGDGHLFAQETDGTRSLRVYFSFVTLATLGYGDYTAAGELGRTVSIVEALAGQLYLVTVVALLVAQTGRRRIGAERSPDRGDEGAAGRG
jgi:voltage-gated potassium channel